MFRSEVVILELMLRVSEEVKLGKARACTSKRAGVGANEARHCSLSPLKAILICHDV